MAELLATVSSLELSEWMAFYWLEPFGETRADLRAGIIAATLQNVMAGGIDGQAAQPADFMPYQDEPDNAPRNADGAILDADPETQSALIMAALFGIAPGE